MERKMIKDINRIILAVTDGENEIKKQKINLKEFKELIKTDYSVSWKLFKNNKRIYRGVKRVLKDITVCTPGKRKSNNTSNYYTYLMSEVLPSWKEYPKRNRAFICSNDINVANQYGSLHYVLPKNGAKIGVCPVNDIWFSFGKYVDNLVLFNDFVYSLFRFVESESRLSWVHTLDYIEKIDSFSDKKITKVFDELRKMFPHNTIINSDTILEDIKSNGCVYAFDKFLNPETHNFSLLTFNDSKKIRNAELFNKVQKECWTDSECIMFTTYQLNDIKELFYV